MLKYMYMLLVLIFEFEHLVHSTIYICVYL